MTLSRLNFRGIGFVPLITELLAGKGAIETQRQRLITNSIFPTNLQRVVMDTSALQQTVQLIRTKRGQLTSMNFDDQTDAARVHKDPKQEQHKHHRRTPRSGVEPALQRRPHIYYDVDCKAYDAGY
jgi:hypothetical protein